MHAIIAEKRHQELEETMLKARNAKYSVPIRYGKVLFCGAAAAGKSNFLHLLMKEDFQPLHISAEVLKPQQVTIAMKAIISSSKGEVEFTKMSINEEILQLESYLPKKYAAPVQKSSLQVPTQDKPPADNLTKEYATSTPPPQESFIQEDKKSADNLLKRYITSTTVTPPQKKLPRQLAYRSSSRSRAKSVFKSIEVNNSKLALATVKSTKKLDDKEVGAVWDILTFMDTGGQPQFISMLPAVNSFAMVTFIIHKMKAGGQNSLNKIVEVQYGNEKGKIFHKLHPQKYTYLQLIETLFSYASNILLPDTTFLDGVKTECKEYEKTKTILLAGTYSGDEQLSENDIAAIDEELAKTVQKSGIDYIKPQLNKNYKFLVPVDNKKQRKTSELQVTAEDTKRYTNPSDIRRYIHQFLNYQDTIHVPIKWLLLELEIRKICQQKNCFLISYDNVLKLTEEKKLGYNGEFGDDVNIDSEQFIKQGLRFHHSFGVLLYFEDVEGMKKLVITNHQWLFNKLSKIVEYSFTCNTVEEMEDLKNGIFKKTLVASDILDISKDFKDSQIDITSVDPINAFLKLLEYLRIAAPLNENAVEYFMPSLLDSCELTDLKEKVPDYKANGIEPLLIQFKSMDNRTYSFPRGAFCFLVVELMVSMKSEPCDQAYVNLITLFKKDTAHYITLIDRIFCLEVHVSYDRDNNIHDEVRIIIDKALQTVGKKFKIDCNLCHGFTCPCKCIEKMHISYLTLDNTKCCWCKRKSVTNLTDSHRVWLKTYLKVCMCVLVV